MALPLLTLRPPPNVDFISGFPGLAPGTPDRPHAAVKGTLEVRSNQPLKVKWVHVELKKIESVPGSPPFVDTVGTKPLTLWEPTNAEYGTLQREDFPFAIRIPESLPPTINLDNNRAGIKYELIATLCMKGKKGLLRRDTPSTHVTSCEIPIYKHEMHSTWPVYAQPDERQTTKDGMTLSVSRRRTCLATAGDQITMQATLFTDFPVFLKSFELALVQKIIYPNTGTTVGKRGPAAGPPPSRSSVISEQKRPQPARIQPGMHQTCELICMLPPNYSAMTVSTARLIENTYEVHVSAVLEGDNSISVGLPVTVSPFPVPYSMDMMQRMGNPPMALDHPSRAHLHQQAASISRPPSAAASMLSPQPQAEPRTSQYGPPTTAPPGRQQRPFHISERVGGQAARDDSLLGGPPSPVVNPPSNPPPGATRSVMPDTLPVEVPRTGGYNEFGQAASSVQQRPPDAQPLTVTSPGPQTARFAVVNLTQRDEPDSPRSSVLHEPYMTAAEEKKRLAQQMRDADAAVQAYASPPAGPPPTEAPAAASNSATSAANASNSGSSTTPKKKWLSAEEEKEKLFQRARDAAELTQRRAANSSNASASNAKASSPKAQKFNESRNEGQTSVPPSQSPSSPAPVSTPVQKSSTSSTSQKWTSAEEEKRRLYERAQAKAMKTQAKAAAAGSAANVTRSNSIQSQGTSQGTSSAAPASIATGPIVNPYTFTTPSSTLKGADLYKSAMSNIKTPTPSTSQTSAGTQKPPSIQESMTPPPTTPPAQTALSAPITPPPPSVTPTRNNSGWMSAEDEKARLRYLEAKRAVEKHTALQDESYGASSSAIDDGVYAGPNGYAGYASQSPSNDASWNVPPSSPPPPNGMSTPLMSIPAAITPPPPSSDPPAFEPSYGYTHATDIPEKEKMRLAMEARDAQRPSLNGFNHASPGMDAPGYDEPPPNIPGYSLGGSSVPLSAAEEKARLRAQYASEENVGTSGSGAGSSSSNIRAEIPMSADGGRMLTAAEEKARLQALQAAARPISSVAPLPPPRIKSPPPSAPHSAASEFSRTPASSSYISSPAVSVSSDDHLKRDPSIAQGKQRALTPSNASTNGTFVAPPPPPPLAPRPPKEYIQQTKEQDAKIRRMTQETINLASYGMRDADGAPGPPWKQNGDFSLGLRPFSPFNPSLDANAGAQASQGSSPLVNSVPRNYPQ